MDAKIVGPDAICATPAGNYVVRLIRPTTEPYEIDDFFDGEEAVWDVIVLFDASCSMTTPFEHIMNVKNLVPFDALKLGLLCNQLGFLNDELNRWANSV